MNSTEEKFLHEVKLFRRWAETDPPQKHTMEWECNYGGWCRIYDSVNDFLAEVEIDKLAQPTVDELLYIIAADNNCQIIVAAIAKYPEKLLHLAQIAIHRSHANAKWQIAVELGNLHIRKSEAESLLIAFAKDEDEYTRRRAMGALAEANSPVVNELIESAWASGHEYQRIMGLSALHKIGSPELEKYLTLAELDGREYVLACAARIRRGETE